MCVEMQNFASQNENKNISDTDSYFQSIITHLDFISKYTIYGRPERSSSPHGPQKIYIHCG